MKRKGSDSALIAQAPRMLESLRGCRAIIRAQLLSILDCHCLADENGDPIRATLEPCVEEEVVEFETVLADIDSIIAAAEITS